MVTGHVHVIGQAVEVLLLLIELLLELEELLLLALADGEVLLRLLAALESIAAWQSSLVASFL